MPKTTDKHDLESLIAETEKNRARLKELCKKAEALDAAIRSSQASKQPCILACIVKPFVKNGSGSVIVDKWRTLINRIQNELEQVKLENPPLRLCDNAWLFLEEGSQNVVKGIKDKCTRYNIPHSISRLHEHPDILLESDEPEEN